MNRLSMSALPSSITIESHFRSNKAVQMKQFLTFETRLVTVFFYTHLIRKGPNGRRGDCRERSQ